MMPKRQPQKGRASRGSKCKGPEVGASSCFPGQREASMEGVRGPRGGWREVRSRGLYYLRENSGNANTKQMRKRTSDSSPCRGSGSGAQA